MEIEVTSRFKEAREEAFRAAINAYVECLLIHAKHAKVDEKYKLEAVLIMEADDMVKVANNLMFQMNVNKKGIDFE